MVGTKDRMVNEMMLSVEEETLIKTVRSLGPEEAQKVLSWAHELAELSNGQEIDWSDSWSDEHLADVTAASLKKAEEQERR
jgi:hypothetical protein